MDAQTQYEDMMKDRVQVMDDGQRLVSLTTPIELRIGSETKRVETLTLRRPTAKEVRAVTRSMADDPIGAGYDLAIGLCEEVPASLLEAKLDPADVMVLGAAGVGFIVPSQPTSTR